MKLIAVLYLEEDEAEVTRLLTEQGVEAWSQMPLEGHGRGAPGWYGTVAPYASSLTFAVVEDATAQRVLRAVSWWSPFCRGLLPRSRRLRPSRRRRQTVRSTWTGSCSCLRPVAFTSPSISRSTSPRIQSRSSARAS